MLLYRACEAISTGRLRCLVIRVDLHYSINKLHDVYLFIYVAVTCMYMHRCTYVPLDICLCMMCIYIYIYTHTDIHTYIHAYIHTYIHAYRFTYTYIYLYLCVCIYVFLHTYCGKLSDHQGPYTSPSLRFSAGRRLLSCCDASSRSPFDETRWAPGISQLVCIIIHIY